MKKAFILITLFVYAFAVIKPVLPLFQDLAAHAFYKAQHMATVHYENGVMHLHADLARTSQDEAFGKSVPAPSSQKANDPFPDHLSEFTAFMLTTDSNRHRFSSLKEVFPTSLFKQIISPPPEFLSRVS